METYNSDLPKIEELVQLENKRLLEVGCGDGRLTALLVSIFEKDEIHIIQKTLNYITSGSFHIQRHDTYGIDHPFADENELYKYFIMNFSTEEDDRVVEKMQAIIGAKKTDRPIIIEDVVNIFLIGK